MGNGKGSGQEKGTGGEQTLLIGSAGCVDESTAARTKSEGGGVGLAPGDDMTDGQRKTLPPRPVITSRRDIAKLQSAGRGT